MPDDELPCLCIANGMAPAAHKRGERCPSWDMLLYGNAYGHIVNRKQDGYACKIEWLDPQDMIIKRSNTMNYPAKQELRSKYDALPRRFVRRMLSPGQVALAAVFALISCALLYHHLNTGDFWIGFGVWYAGTFVSFWLTEAYKWSGGK